jgi:hypothetical protein
MTVRYSTMLLLLAVVMLLGVPHVIPSASWTLYHAALASLAGAAISFFALND